MKKAILMFATGCLATAAWASDAPTTCTAGRHGVMVAYQYTSADNSFGFGNVFACLEWDHPNIGFSAKELVATRDEISNQAHGKAVILNVIPVHQ